MLGTKTRTLMSAQERRAMIERLQARKRSEQSTKATTNEEPSEEPPAEEPKEGLTEAQKAELERIMGEKKAANMLRVAGSHNPPIAGVLSGSEWNKFVKDCWSYPENIIIHTVLMPEGKSLRDVSFLGATIKSSRVLQLAEGEVPDTATGPSELFECFVESTCIHPNHFIPNHFLVANPRNGLKLDANTKAAERAHSLEHREPDSVWTQEMKRYTGRT